MLTPGHLAHQPCEWKAGHRSKALQKRFWDMFFTQVLELLLIRLDSALGSSKAMTARSPTDRMVSTTKREADGFQWSERSEDS